MLTRTTGTVFRDVARKAVDLILRRQPKSKWVDDVTPPWVSNGFIHHTAEDTLRDVSGAFDDQTEQ